MSLVRGLKEQTDTTPCLETMLWQNSNTTTVFSERTIILNDAIPNYRYIKFEFYKSNTATDLYSVIYDKNEVLKFIATRLCGNMAVFAGGNQGENSFIRPIMYINDTSLKIGNCLYGADSYNNLAIPYRIYGIQ